jgi:membrane protease subunit (stomatin/prohibitin family)
MAQSMMGALKAPAAEPTAAAAADSKFCMDCGGAMPKRAKFCPGCGKPQP